MLAPAPPQSAPVSHLRIGPVVVDPPVLQAPMAGYTNFAYRQVVREFGGTISGEVDGTPFAGDFEEHAHDHD